MTNQETIPQNQEAQNPAAQEMQRRIDAATPQEVRDALVAYSTDFAERTENITLAQQHGKTVEYATLVDHVDDAIGLQATATAMNEWSQLEPEDRPSFRDYVTQQEAASFDHEGNPIGDTERAFSLSNASNWMSDKFDTAMEDRFVDRDMGVLLRKPNPEFGLASGNFIKLKRDLQAQETAILRESEQQTAQEAEHKAIIVDEARKSMEAVHEQSKLTETIVNFGKNKTYVYGYGERGFDSTIGDMEKDDTKKLQERVRKSKVNHAFGAHDHNGEVHKPENVNWREAGVGERVSFIPVVEQEFRTETRTEVVESKRFGKDVTREVPFQVVVPGSEHQKMVVNPETGQQEPAVLFQYDFDPGALQDRDNAVHAIGYEGLNSTRTGAVLSVAVELPKSIADKLLANIEKQPGYVRQIAEVLVVNNSDGRISQEDWDKGRPPYNTRMKPPYERVKELAPNWKIAIAKPRPGADIASFANGRKGESFEVTKHEVA